MTAVVEHFADSSCEPAVRGFLHRPATPGNMAGIILSHGAGSNAQAPLLVALAELFAAEGWTVLRCNLPYRQDRSFGPPRPGDAARDRAGLNNAVAAMRAMASGRAFLGGHSYGGRQSTMLCAEEPGLVDGLLLLSYPLHPPRKPEQLRAQHLPNLHTDAMFVHGTRDPFGSIAEIEQAIKLIPARTRLVPVEGAGHDLAFKKGKNEPGNGGLPTQIRDAFCEFFGERR